MVNITLVPKAAGFLYLEVVLDAGSRKPDAERQSEIVGWSIANHLRTWLELNAVKAATGQRRPSSAICHIDQGCRTLSSAFGKRCGFSAHRVERSRAFAQRRRWQSSPASRGPQWNGSPCNREAAAVRRIISTSLKQAKPA